MSYVIDTYVLESQGSWQAEVHAVWLAEFLPDGWTRWSLAEWDEFLINGVNAEWVKDSIDDNGHSDRFSDYDRQEQLVAVEVTDATDTTVVFG